MQKVIDSPKLDFCDVLIRPKRSEAASRKEIQLSRLFTGRHDQGGFTCVPIIAANMDTTGTIEMNKSLTKFEMMTALHKHYKIDDIIDTINEDHGRKAKFYQASSWFTMGIHTKDFDKLRELKQKVVYEIHFICIDVANGYTQHFVDAVADVRKLCPSAFIMAGNVATPEMVQELIITGGADVVKIGIGSGSVCITRKVTGVGYPQLSAIMECADAAHGLKGFVCADGGCTCPGDVAKAFGAGADFVMLGGFFAGCDECNGEWIYDNGMYDLWIQQKPPHHKKTHFKYYGMSSEEAQNKYDGGMADYKASEGKCVTIPAKGPVKKVCKEILGGLRSTCSYTGAKTIKGLPRCTTFIKVQNGKQLNEVYSE